MSKRIRIWAAALAMAMAPMMTAEAMMLGSGCRTAGLQETGRGETVSGTAVAGKLLCRRSLTGCLSGGLPATSPRLEARREVINRTINARPARGGALQVYVPSALRPMAGEALARAKRDRLLVDGIPGSALQLTTVSDEAGERMVLEVATDNKIFVLDVIDDVLRQNPVDRGVTASTPARPLPQFRFR